MQHWENRPKKSMSDCQKSQCAGDVKNAKMQILASCKNDCGTLKSVILVTSMSWIKRVEGFGHSSEVGCEE